MDLSTGKVVRGGDSGVAQLGCSKRSFDNLDTTTPGVVAGVDFGNGFTEWIDVGIKASPSGSNQVDSFTFEYATSKMDPSLGGVGGTVTWSFYPSHSAGATHPATSDSSFFTLTGLPGHPFEGDFSLGEYTTHRIEVSFGCVPFVLSDGVFGYGWVFEDEDDSGTGHPGTVPLFACVSACANSGPDMWGSDDLIDRYQPGVPGAAPVSTFTEPGFATSINLSLNEYDCPSTLSPVTTTTLNDDLLSVSPVILGQDFTAMVTPHANRTPGGALITLRLGPPIVPFPVKPCTGPCGPPGTPCDPTSEIIVNLFNPSCFGGSGWFFVGHFGGGVPSAPVTCPIPCDYRFVGLTWTAQALLWGDDLTDVPPDPLIEFDCKFSTGWTGTVGTH